MKKQKILSILLIVVLTTALFQIVTAAPGGIPGKPDKGGSDTGTTISVPISAGIDDGDSSCLSTLSKNEVYFGLDDLDCPNTPFTSGLRFANVELPRGAVVTEAYIEFTADGPYSNALNLRIYGDDSDNSLDLSNGFNRSFTSSYSSWNIKRRWKSNQSKRTPDISSIVSEIVSRPGWNSGNSMSYFITHVSGESHRRMFAYERDPNKAAKLVITYEGGCKELYPGINNPLADRINVVFVGLSYENMIDFIQDMKTAVDYYGGEPGAGGGLLEMTIYQDNKNKFNFWYVDNIYAPKGDPSVSCTNLENPAAYNVCSGLPNTYYANFGDLSFRSCAYFGGRSFNSVTASDWPFTFDHEFQHQLPMLRDEYVEGTSDRPGAPNCAPDLTTAQTWWGDLYGQTSSDGLLTGYYDGCSYILGNYRPTSTSVMKARAEFRLGLVNERKVFQTLALYSSSSPALENAIELTFVGKPGDADSYELVNVKKAKKQNKETDSQNKVYVKVGDKVFDAGFEMYDYLAIDDMTGDELTGTLQKIPKYEVKVNVAIGDYEFDPVKGKVKSDSGKLEDFTVEIH